MYWNQGVNITIERLACVNRDREPAHRRDSNAMMIPSFHSLQPSPDGINLLLKHYIIYKLMSAGDGRSIFN